MSKATITESAAKEINEILSYIAVKLKNPIAARNVHNAILNTVENLCIFPQSAALTKSATANAYGARQQIVKNFCMFYYYNSDADEVRILHVHYAAKDFDNMNLEK